MAKRKRRADGRMEIKRKMPDGSVRHFLGKTAAECERKCRDALVNFEVQNKAAKGPLFEKVAWEWWAQATMRYWYSVLNLIFSCWCAV